jgi:hypothetical protein
LPFLLSFFCCNQPPIESAATLRATALHLCAHNSGRLGFRTRLERLKPTQATLIDCRVHQPGRERRCIQWNKLDHEPIARKTNGRLRDSQFPHSGRGFIERCLCCRHTDAKIDFRRFSEKRVEAISRCVAKSPISVVTSGARHYLARLSSIRAGVLRPCLPQPNTMLPYRRENREERRPRAEERSRC